MLRHVAGQLRIADAHVGVQGLRDRHKEGGRMMSLADTSAISPVPTATTVDAWLQWFATEKQATCRAYLCTRYHLNALDAEALINTALLQVLRYWASIDNPLAYVWQTLTHAVAKQGRRRAYERQQLMTYA
jgi:hypothetical protein